MAAKWTMDWDERIFILKAGVTEIDVQIDLYSDWKEETLIGDNGKYAPAMRTVGGDAITETQSLGDTYFLINGYRIRPQEASHELTITGNIFTDPAGDPIVLPTLGTFTVLVTNAVSNLVDSSISSLDVNQLLDAIYIDTFTGTPGTEEGIGTPTNPSSNITDARVIADTIGLRSYVLVASPLTVTADHIAWKFEGSGNAIITVSNADVSGSQFKFVELTGTATAPFVKLVLDEGKLSNFTNFTGNVGKAILEGTITLAPGSTTMNAVASAAPGGLNRPIIDMVGAGRDLSVRQYSGGLQINNCVAPNKLSIDLVSGTIIFDSSCTGGDIIVRGVGQIVDNTGGALTFDKTGLVEATDVRLTRKINQNKLITNQATEKLEVFDDDGTPLVSGDIFEDAGGSQPYRGQGVERRERLE
jgi:hypothetical protein